MGANERRAELVRVQGLTNTQVKNWNLPMGILQSLPYKHHCGDSKCDNRGNKEDCWADEHYIICVVCAYIVKAENGCDKHAHEAGYNLRALVDRKRLGAKPLLNRFKTAMKSNNTPLEEEDKTLLQKLDSLITEWELEGRREFAQKAINSSEAAATEQANRAATKRANNSIQVHMNKKFGSSSQPNQGRSQARRGSNK